MFQDAQISDSYDLGLWRRLIGNYAFGRELLRQATKIACGREFLRQATKIACDIEMISQSTFFASSLII